MKTDLPKFGAWIATKDQKPRDGFNVLGLWISFKPEKFDERVEFCFREMDFDTGEYQWIKARNGKAAATPPQFWADVIWTDHYDDGQPNEAELWNV